MSQQHGDMWTCGRCGRREFSPRSGISERKSVKPEGWETMTLRKVPHVEIRTDDDRPIVDDTKKDLCGECVSIVREVWDGKERAEVRKADPEDRDSWHGSRVDAP